MRVSFLLSNKPTWQIECHRRSWMCVLAAWHLTWYNVHKKRQCIVQSTVAEYTNFISQRYCVSLQMVMLRATAPAGEQTHWPDWATELPVACDPRKGYVLPRRSITEQSSENKGSLDGSILHEEWLVWLHVSLICQTNSSCSQRKLPGNLRTKSFNS